MDRVKTLDPLSGATRLEPVGAGAGESGGRRRGRRLVAPGGAGPEGFGVGERAFIDGFSCARREGKRVRVRA